jgi:acyl dehydratase
MSADIGHVFTGRPRHLTLARALALSGGPFDAPGWPARNLHTDIKIANEVGLSAVVASGTQSEGYLVGLLVELFSMAWLKYGELDIRLPHSVHVGDIITPKVRLDSRSDTDRGAMIALNVWCDNQDGKQVLVGTARCIVPSHTA